MLPDLMNFDGNLRCTLNIPCLWQLGVIPRFDGYACHVALPLLVFLTICGFISVSLHHQYSGHDEARSAYTDSSVGPKGVRLPAPGPVHDSPSDIFHYGVIIDCGSSGSRIFVYHWPPHTGLPDQLLHIQPVRDQDGKPYIKKIEPGISSYADKPSQAAEYLRPLLDYALLAVPEGKRKETPLYIYSTAGMRMLPTRDQEVILSDLRSDIPLWYDFLFAATHTEVITGKQEAIYAWISINYALGRFDHSIGVSSAEHLSLVELPGPEGNTHVRKQTVGIIDMGGGSLQIAYEVPHSEEVAKGLVTEFSLGCTKNDVEHVYRLYVATFLGYGSNSARKQYEQSLFANLTNISTNGSHVGTQLVQDPCLPIGFREQISSPAGDQMLTLQGSGNFKDCKARLKFQLNQTATCMKEPCSINGVFQPDIDYDHSQFYGFSEFFYTMEDLLGIGGEYNYRKFQSLAREFCLEEWSKLEEWQRQGKYPRADQNRYRLQCFKSAWMSVILHEGLGFPIRYKNFQSVQYVRGEEIQWTLGALLYKTKYYPLRDLEKHNVHNYRPPWRRVYHTNYLVIICAAVVVVAILVYMRRLRPWRSPDMRRVPTMSYFMTEDGQAQEGLLSVDGFSAPSSSEKFYQYS